LEQLLSVALIKSPFLALPWLPLRKARFPGAASFIRLALRADAKHNQRGGEALDTASALIHRFVDLALNQHRE
jgi:hypothetical protein